MFQILTRHTLIHYNLLLLYNNKIKQVYFTRSSGKCFSREKYFTKSATLKEKDKQLHPLSINIQSEQCGRAKEAAKNNYTSSIVQVNWVARAPTVNTCLCKEKNIYDFTLG